MGRSCSILCPPWTPHGTANCATVVLGAIEGEKASRKRRREDEEVAVEEGELEETESMTVVLHLPKVNVVSRFGSYRYFGI
jgi:hypothetical protein